MVDERFEVVDAQLATLRHELRAEMERGFRRQTGALLGVMITGFAAVLAPNVSPAQARFGCRP
ncbi:MAG: hypothetical protein AMXMBFR46_27060 [Acidimicrobiia bacterium]